MEHSEKECDVLIAGAGPAGISAAVASARMGASTILAEQKDLPGGTAVTGMHRFICGLYACGDNFPADTVNNGIAREISLKLKEIAPGNTVQKMGKTYVLPCNARDLVKVFIELCGAEKELAVQYNTGVVSVKTGQGCINSVTIQDGNGTIIKPKAVIDCSGKAAVIKLSGAGYRLSPKEDRQLSGFSFRIKGLTNINEMTAIRVPYSLAKAVEEKRMPYHLKFTTFSPGDDADDGYCRLSLLPEDDNNRTSLSEEDARMVHKHLSETVDEFSRSVIADMSSEIADREGARMKGEYTLNRDDILSARKFDNNGVKNTWPIELWDREKGPQYSYLEPGEYYEIPAGCLKSKEIPNLFAAGRCISVSREALGSTRVMGACISLGEQAGLAAARFAGKTAAH